MKTVYICSPLRGDLERNISKANGYCLFAAKQFVIPIAPHVMFAGFLDDNIPEERELGIKMGLALLKHCDEVWVFGNRISQGMEFEVKAAEELNIPVQYFNDKCEEQIFQSKP